MPRVIHFEIPADDMERASRFYADVFAWQITKWEGSVPYWLAATGSEDEPGIDGALAKRDDPQEGTVNTIGVPSMDEFLQKVVAGGETIVRPEMPVPGVGYVAYCRDTEGNLFAMMEDDPTAA